MTRGHRTDQKEMARRFYTPRGTTLILAIVFVNAIVQRIDAYPRDRRSIISKSERSLRSLDNARNGFKPSCGNLTFCTNTPDYPSDWVNEMLKGNESLKLLATVDVLKPISERMDEDDGVALCTSKEDVVRITMSLSIRDQWLYIVNTEEYVQMVRVEICTSPNTTCSMIDGFAEGYKSTCKQNYIYRQMVALGPDGVIMPEQFKIPASCKCVVKFTGDLYLRMGVNLNKNNKQSPVPKRRKI